MTKQKVGFHFLQETQPPLWCVAATWQGKAGVNLSLYFPLNSVSFLLLLSLPQGQESGSWWRALLLSLALVQGRDSGAQRLPISSAPRIKLCLYHPEQKHSAACKLLCVQCQHLCVCACMCWCFANPLSLGHFAVHPGVHSYLGCPAWCLVWHVQKAHCSECLLGLGGFFCRVRWVSWNYPQCSAPSVHEKWSKKYSRNRTFFY